MNTQGKSPKNDAIPASLPKSSLYNRAMHLETSLRSGRIYLDYIIPTGSERQILEVVKMGYELQRMTAGLIEICSLIHLAANSSMPQTDSAYYQVIRTIVKAMDSAGYFEIEDDQPFRFMVNGVNPYEEFVRGWFVDFVRLSHENNKGNDEGLFQFRLQLTQDAGKSALEMKQRLMEIYAVMQANKK